MAGEATHPTRAHPALVRVALALALVLLLVMAWIAFAVLKEGGPGSILEWEEMTVAAPPDGTEDEVGGGWEVVAAWDAKSFDLEEGFDPPRSPLYAYMNFELVVLHRRRFQAYLPLHLIGIR